MVTVREGLASKYPDTSLLYAEGYDLETNELKLQDALRVASQSDVVIVAVGERYFSSGEAKSRADINIPQSHQQLVKELKQTGKKVIVLLMGGRPMIFNEYSDAAKHVKEKSDHLKYLLDGSPVNRGNFILGSYHKQHNLVVSDTTY